MIINYIFVITLLTLLWVIYTFIFNEQSEHFTNLITLTQIRDRFRHLVFILGLNPNKITRNNLFTIIKTYKHLHSQYTLTNKYITEHI